MTLPNRLGAHTGSYEPYTLEEALAGISAAGYRYVELAAIHGFVEHVPLDADAATINKILRMLNIFDLIPISLSSHSDLTTVEGVTHGLQGIDLCYRLGIAVMNTAVGGPVNEDEDENEFLSHIESFADYAAERNVVIGIEIHGKLTGTALKTRHLIEKIGHENVRINYDTSNSEYFEGVVVYDDLPNAFPYVVHCHLKDCVGGIGVWDFPAVGAGHIDFERVLSSCHENDFHGPFSVEIEFQGKPWPSLETVNPAMLQSRKHLVDLGLT